MSTIVTSNLSDGTLSIPTTYVTNGSAKAWGDISFSSGTPVDANSFNVSSLTDVGVGRVDLNLTNAMASANHAAASAPNGSNFVRRRLKSTTAIKAEVTDAATGGSYGDVAFSIVIFGDLA